jgi:RNA polymerase sigma-70 factor (ECF subfamily)
MDIEKLYQEYFSVVYKYILSISKDPLTAEEMTQETFFKALKKIDEFRGDCSVRVWLCQIAKNTYFAWYNEQKKSDSLDYFTMVSDGKDIEDEYIQKELSQKALFCLHELEEPYKEVFMLSVFGGFSLKDISLVFGKSESWARVTFYRAKQKLLERMR